MPSTRSVSFASPGAASWVVPANVRGVLISAIGGGGGGGASLGGSSGGGGGGSAEYCRRHPLRVTPAATLAIVIATIGAGGVSGVIQNATNGGGGNGGDTTISNGTTVLLLRHGLGGDVNTGGGSGFPQGSSGGGGIGGAPGCSSLQSGVSGIFESNTFFGGSSGSGKSTNSVVFAPNGGPCECYLGGIGPARILDGGGTFRAGGGGGAASAFGPGGDGGTPLHNGGVTPFASYGAGGGGGGGSAGSTSIGGDGRSGFVLIEWEE